MATKEEHKLAFVVMIWLVLMLGVALFYAGKDRQDIRRIESCLSRPTYQVCEKP